MVFTHDALSKVAGLSLSEARDVAARLGEKFHTKSILRAQLRAPESIPVPFADRVKSFKYWKTTGKLPEASHWEGSFRRFREGAWDMPYVRSDEPVTVFSGGTVPGLESATNRPRTLLDHSHLIPGDTRVPVRGLYAGTQEEASKYMGRGRVAGPHGLAEITVPRKRVVGNLVPGSLKRVESEVVLPPEPMQANIREVVKEAGLPSERELIGRAALLFASKDVKNMALPEQDPGHAEAEQKIKDLKSRLGRRYNVTPFLTGSMKTGLNVPGKVDYDFAVRVKSPEKFERLKRRIGKRLAPSPYNKPNQDLYVFQGEMDGEPVDFTVFHGQQAEPYKKTREQLRDELMSDPNRRLKLIREKAAVKEVVPDLPVIGAPLVRRYKKALDEELGLYRSRRRPVAKAHEPVVVKTARALTDAEHKRLTRSTVFGHRTGNVEPIITSGKLLSAAEAGRRGLLTSVESADPTSREREAAQGLKKLRAEVFMTRGLMPSDATYGQYGVLFEKRKADPSRYLNTIPEEHVAPNVARSKMTFVVPDQEYDQWQASHPHRRIIRESEVPESKRLGSKDYTALVKRLVSGPKLTQATEEVALPTPAA